MTDVDYGVFDGDNHYYEALDAFTRHLDPALARGWSSGWTSTGGSTTPSAAGCAGR